MEVVELTSPVALSAEGVRSRNYSFSPTMTVTEFRLKTIQDEEKYRNDGLIAEPAVFRDLFNKSKECFATPESTLGQAAWELESETLFCVWEETDLISGYGIEVSTESWMFWPKIGGPPPTD